MDFFRKLFGNSGFARSRGDKLGVLTFLIGGVFTIWYEVFHIMPSYDISPEFKALNYAVACWCYVSTLSNWLKLVSTRVYPFYVELESKREADWRYCQRCFMFSPPRSHHCKVCNVCVLKRDHHCWFAGYCIGYHNHRYYLVMVAYMWFSALYCNIFNIAYLRETFHDFGVLSCVFSILMPHGAALLGLVSFYQFSVCIVTFIGFLCLAMFSWLLQIQLSQIYSGQTKHERKLKVFDYDSGVVDNFRDVFGPKIFLAFVSAFIKSPVLGDGVKFFSTAKNQ